MLEPGDTACVVLTFQQKETNVRCSLSSDLITGLLKNKRTKNKVAGVEEHRTLTVTTGALQGKTHTVAPCQGHTVGTPSMGYWLKLNALFFETVHFSPTVLKGTVLGLRKVRMNEQNSGSPHLTKGTGRLAKSKTEADGHGKVIGIISIY